MFIYFNFIYFNFIDFKFQHNTFVSLPSIICEMRKGNALTLCFKIICEDFLKSTIMLEDLSMHNLKPKLGRVIIMYSTSYRLALYNDLKF